MNLEQAITKLKSIDTNITIESVSKEITEYNWRAQIFLSNVPNLEPKEKHFPFARGRTLEEAVIELAKKVNPEDNGKQRTN